MQSYITLPSKTSGKGHCTLEAATKSRFKNLETAWKLKNVEFIQVPIQYITSYILETVFAADIGIEHQ